MLKAIVILNGAGGELARIDVQVPEGHDAQEALGAAIRSAIAESDWRLECGDTITIEQA